MPDLKAAVEKARLTELESKVEAARYESELAMLKEQVTKLEERLYSGSITNVRELTAIETEHNVARRNRARVEESVAPSKSVAQEATDKHARLKSELAEREEKWTQRRKELLEERARVGSEFKEIGAGRASVAEGIPDTDLAIYNALLPRMSGLAVVKVERGICQGCRVRLPIGEIVNMQNSVSLVNCSSCGRILLAE